MALSLNLYHEVLRAKKQEQYDPLKLSLFGMIVIAVCLAGYYVLALAKKSSAVSAAKAAAAEYAKLLPQEKQAKQREEELGREINMAEVLTKQVEDRFYWAPVLEQIALEVPRNVQLLKLSGDIRESRRCVMTIEGIAAGAGPRQVAEELRTAITERLGSRYRNATAVFRALDDSKDRVLLDGNQFASVVFTIGVEFDLRESPPEESPESKAKPQIAKKN